jgi:nucleoside-diphosphate-sugar epimerase
MKVLVTGAGGSLGGAVARRLLARGDSVRTFQRGDYPALRAAGAQTLRGDVAEYAPLEDACRGMDAVVHCAAKAGIWGAEDAYRRANVAGTRNLLAACRIAGVRRLVFTSSPSVVFNGRDMEGADESVPYPAHYDAPYPRTKAEAEKLVLAANGPALSTVALRPHLVWGPDDSQLVPRIIARARAGRLRRFTGPPKKVDTTYIEDAAAAHLLALDRLAPGAPCAGKPYFITSGDPRPVWEIIDGILQAAGLPPLKRTISPLLAAAAGGAFEVLYSFFGIAAEPPMTRFLAHELATAHWFDISAARRDLGYAPSISIEEGFRRLRERLQSGR